MATLQDQDIVDLAAGTLKELGRLRFNQIAQTIQHHEVMNRILREDRVQFDDGIAIQRTLQLSHSGAAKQVGLYETDTVNVADTLANMSVPWRHTTTNYAFERREMLTNRGFSRIVDILQTRRTDAMISLIELMETQFWSAPSGSSDKLNLYGVPYWIVNNTTTGFNGGDPSGFSDTGGIASGTNANWKNYTDQFEGSTIAKTADNGLPNLRTAYRKIRFKSPVDVPDFRQGNGDQYRLYTDEAGIQDFEDLGEGQNENLGRDVAAMDGVMTFRRNPIIWVPELDSSSLTLPIYMINFAYFHPVFLKGDYLREAEPDKAPNQHNVWQVHVDLTWNVLCTDRRRQALVYGGG